MESFGDLWAGTDLVSISLKPIAFAQCLEEEELTAVVGMWGSLPAGCLCWAGPSRE